jgi:hypothetical protein
MSWVYDRETRDEDAHAPMVTERRPETISDFFEGAQTQAVRLYSSSVSLGMGSLKGLFEARYRVLSGNRTVKEGSGGGGGNGSSAMVQRLLSIDPYNISFLLQLQIYH